MSGPLPTFGPTEVWTTPFLLSRPFDAASISREDVERMARFWGKYATPMARRMIQAVSEEPTDAG